MHRRFVDRFRPDPLASSQEALEQWLTGPSGQYLLAKERQLLQQLPHMHGYHLMELGVSASGSLLDQFDNLHRFALGSTVGNQGTGAVVDLKALPLPCDTVETAVVHHALEFSQRPHLVLNEVARVVVPGGHIMLFVLNPFCLFGLLKWPYSLIGSRQVWRHHSLRLGRLVDWLRLLNFRPVAIKRGGFGPLPPDVDLPQNERKITTWCRHWGCGAGLPTGLFYTIVARKHVVKPIHTRNDLWKNLKARNFGWQHQSKPSQQHGVAAKKRCGVLKDGQRKELESS